MRDKEQSNTMSMIKYRECKHQTTVCMAFLIALIAGKTQAEYFGLNNGRLGNPDKPGSLSVELGLVTGKLIDLDYDNPTLRINYQLKKEIQLFADLSKASVGKLDENAFGVGAFYSLGKLFPFSENVTLKGSIHKARLYKYNNGRLIPYCTGSMPMTNPYDGSLTIDPGYCSSRLVPGSSSASPSRYFRSSCYSAASPSRRCSSIISTPPGISMLESTASEATTLAQSSEPVEDWYFHLIKASCMRA